MNRKLGSTLLVCYIHIDVYTYMQYMLMRLGTIAGYEHILCSQVYLGVLGSWMLSRIWSRLRFFAGNALSIGF